MVTVPSVWWVVPAKDIPHVHASEFDPYSQC
jgi:hypothetical protein